MANEGLAIIVGVAFAAIAAIGTVIYNAYQQRQQEYEYKNQSHGSRFSHSKSSTGVKCEKCDFSMAGRITKTLACGHVFHAACIKWESQCPVRGCSQKIPREFSSAPKQKGLANCSSCSHPLTGQDIVRMRCRHIFHSDCIEMDDTCPLGCRM